MITLGAEEAAAIRGHARRAYPEECCGALLGRVHHGVSVVDTVQEVLNLREEERGRRFLVDPRDYLTIERAARTLGLEVLGFYHSHPDHPAVPSEFDRLHAWPNLHYVIVAVAGGMPGEMTSWLLSEDRSIMQSEPVTPRRRTA